MLQIQFSIRKRLLIVLPLIWLGIGDPAQAAEELNLDQLLERFGWNFETAEIKTQQVGEGLYVLFGLGGNIAVSVGDQGVLIVDDQFPELMPQIEAAIAKIGGNGVDFAINTHWHFDHAQGNLALDPEETLIVSQSKSREMMTKSNVLNLVFAKYRQEAYPEDALPVVTFDDRMQIHYNGERIDLLHFGPAHTTGDTAVFFRGHNAVHMGDVFNNTGYPFIDAGNGGEIDGMIAFCRAALAELERDAIVIPGHGEVTDYQALKAYTDMLQSCRDRIAALIDEGKTLAEIVASKPTAEFKNTYGDVSKSLGFIDRVYTSLVAKKR